MRRKVLMHCEHMTHAGIDRSVRCPCPAKWEVTRSGRKIRYCGIHARHWRKVAPERCTPIPDELTEMCTVVRKALKDAISKRKLSIVAMVYAVPEAHLEKFAKGDDSALPDYQVRYLVAGLSR